MRIEIAHEQDGDALAELRVLAMQKSLEELGRFDQKRARQRFLENFQPEKTQKILVDEELVGFYVVTEFASYFYIDHLYVDPRHQGKKIGSAVLTKIIADGRRVDKPVKLGALKGSASNRFYKSHGFIQVDEGEYDNYYELKHS